MTDNIDYEKLYQVYYMKVYSYVMTIMKNHSEAEELTQETFFRALKSKYRGESSEYSWLCAIAKNLCVDTLKKKGRYTELDETLASAQSIETLVLDKESTLRIHMVLHNIDEPYKEVFSLRIFGELSFAKIGMIFGKTENWSRVTYHRARLKIQEMMNEKGVNENEV